MSDEILRVNNLVKTYPNGCKALRGVSFDVKKGEFVDVKIESSNEFELIGSPV